MDDLEAPALRFELLGPLRVSRGDSTVDLGSAQRQAVLATLALRPGRPISRDRMLGAVWGDDPPAYAVNLLQKHVSALRRQLRPDPLLTWTDRGYVLAVPPGSRDVDTFERAVETGRQARDAGDPAGAAAAFRTALECWRGPLCDGLPGPYLEAERHRYEELRLGVAADRAEAELALPGRTEVTGELRRLVAEHPAHERLRGLLMLALYRGGRRSAAMTEFRELTRLLRDEYGVEPTAGLQQLHRRMLDADPGLEPVPARPSAPTALLQLPPRLPDFVDREDEVTLLNGLLEDRATVAVIAGTAGVGKTSLAVHWAHEVRDRFPDGQLYANLRGFDPDGAEAAPGEVIRGFLSAFAVPAHAVPAGLAEQTALYRSLLTGRRVLVLLDNARSSEQVRPLLPGASGCLTVVTSRNDLTGLVVAEGARPVTVELPGYAVARQLLRSRIGADRVGAEPAAVTTLITACARLPLALAVVAARAVIRPGLALSTVAEEMREGLDALRGTEARGTDVRAAFDWSYQQLSPIGGADVPAARRASGAGFRGRRRGRRGRRAAAGDPPHPGRTGRRAPDRRAGRPVRAARPASRVRDRPQPRRGPAGRPDRRVEPGAGPLPADRAPGRRAAQAASRRPGRAAAGGRRRRGRVRRAGRGARPGWRPSGRCCWRWSGGPARTRPRWCGWPGPWCRSSTTRGAGRTRWTCSARRSRRRNGSTIRGCAPRRTGCSAPRTCGWVVFRRRTPNWTRRWPATPERTARAGGPGCIAPPRGRSSGSTGTGRRWTARGRPWPSTGPPGTGPGRGGR